MIYIVLLFVWHTRRPCKTRDEKRTVLARAVVVARYGEHDVVKRGDDDDDAGRCRSDARPRPRAAFAAAERLRVTVDADGADIAGPRGGFPISAFQICFDRLKTLRGSKMVKKDVKCQKEGS